MAVAAFQQTLLVDTLPNWEDLVCIEVLDYMVDIRECVGLVVARQGVVEPDMGDTERLCGRCVVKEINAHLPVKK